MEKKKLTRTQFVATVANGAGTVLIGGTAANIFSESAGSSRSPFQKVSLGKSVITTTLLGMGTGSSGFNRTSAIPIR